MYLIVIGVLTLALKLAEVGPVGQWSWWVVLAPFGGAALWWAWADASGWSKRRAMDKLQERKDKRRLRNMEALGTGPRRRH